MSDYKRKELLSLDLDKSSKNSENYTCDDSVLEVLKKMANLFTDEVLCDVTLVAADKDTKVNAHRMVLAASSEYFLAMFGGSLKESQTKEVNFTKIDGQTLRTVITFIYTYSIELQTDTVENILKAAHLFQLKRLEVACCDYLTKQLDPSNCLGIALFAEQYNYTTLYESCFAFALQHFMTLRNNEEFFLLDEEHLSRLLSSDKLRAPSEEDVFHSLVSWIEYDSVNRDNLVGKLIHCVRLTLLQPKFIALVVESVCKSIECRDLISTTYKWNLLPELRQSLLPKEQTTLRSLKDVAIAISGWDNTGGTLKVGLYYAESDDWIYREWPGPPEQRVDFGSTTVDDKLIIAGGKLASGEASNRVDCLDLRTLKWMQLPSLETSRYSCDMATLNGQVYVVGGQNRATGHLNSVEKWDPLTAQWKSVAPMAITMSNPCVGVKGNTLCVTQQVQTQKNFHIYDPLTDSWSSWLNIDFNLLGMATVSINGINHFILVSKSEIKTVNLQDNTITDNRFNKMDFAKNCAVFGDRVIVYNETIFKEYGNFAMWKAMPELKNDKGKVVLISS